MDPITPNTPAPASPDNNQSFPPTPPPPPPAPPVTPAPGAWTPDMAVDPSTGGMSSSVYISNPLALLRPSWNAIKLNLGALLFPAVFLIPFVIILIILAVGGVFLGKANPALGGGLLIAGIVLILAFLVFVLLIAPYVTIALLASARSQKINFRDTFAQSRHLAGRFFVMGLLTGLAVLGGFILLVIPGIIFGAWFSLAGFTMVAENLGPVDSMKRSKELVKGHMAETLGILSVPTAVNIITIVPFIGPIISTLFGLGYSAAPAIRYLQLSELKSSGAPAPKVHWLNYAAIVLAVISLPLRAITTPKPSTPVAPSTTQTAPTPQ